MLLMKIFFAVLIIVCIVFYIMYLWDFALVLLVIICTIPIVMFIMTLITKHMIDVDLVAKGDAAAKNENFPVQIRIKNRSVFPVGKAEANVEYHNAFTGDSDSFCLFLPIQPRNDQSVSFRMSSKYCGIVRIRCESIIIYDPLRIFKFRIGRNISTDIAVMPEGHDVNGEVCYSDRESEESSVFSEHKPGDDPSEIFDLREYNPGDKLNRIHWKLSSKKDEFIVKEYSLPVDVPCTVFLDLYSASDGEYRLPIYDTLVETFVSLSRFLIENERVHNVIYFNSNYGVFVEKTVDSAETLAETIQELICSLGDGFRCDPPSSYFADNDRLSLSSFAFITSSTDEDVFEFIDESIDADIKNALVVVTSPEAAPELPTNYSDINTIPVVIGRITSSIKGIEL